MFKRADYTGDRKSLHALGGALGDTGDKAKYESVKATFQKVKDDSFAAEKFLADNGQTPRFLGMVGGSIELPYYICDIHARYKYWDTQIDYVPADTPYATMRTDVDYSRFVKPDLGVGRVIADSVLDATLMLARTFFRKEFLPGGKYAALAPAGWETKAVLYDGHRLNQPDEGGPDASPKEPFYPANEVMAALPGRPENGLRRSRATKPRRTTPGRRPANCWKRPAPMARCSSSPMAIRLSCGSRWANKGRTSRTTWRPARSSANT